VESCPEINTPTDEADLRQAQFSPDLCTWFICDRALSGDCNRNLAESVTTKTKYLLDHQLAQLPDDFLVIRFLAQ
jgi:hypothetical protein